MAGVIEFFCRFWILCFSLAGVQTHSGENNGGLLLNGTSLLQLLKISDVTSIGDYFLSNNTDFHRNISLRHGASKLKWHFMSGAAVFVPKLNSNILFERVFYSLDSGKGHRSSVYKSFIVFTQWSSNWASPMAPTQLLKANATVGSMYSDDLMQNSRKSEGPEDSRVIYNTEKEEISLNFNVLTPIKDRQMFGQTIKLFRDTGYQIKYNKTEPLIQFEHPKGYRAGTEKNWVPILIKGELHYVYSLSPLRILKCEVESDKSAKNLRKTPKESDKTKDISFYKKICRVQFKGEAVDSGSQTGALRSGTNWVEYSPGVYFSFARTSIMSKKCSNAIYRPHLIVLKFNIDAKSGAYSDPHLISVSGPVTEFDSKLLEVYAKKGLANGNKCDNESILTPGSISRWTGMTQNEDSDIADVIISINDDVNALLRIKGLGQSVQKAIDSAPSSETGTLVARAESAMKKFVEAYFKTLLPLWAKFRL